MFNSIIDRVVVGYQKYPDMGMSISIGVQVWVPNLSMGRGTNFWYQMGKYLDTGTGTEMGTQVWVPKWVLGYRYKNGYYRFCTSSNIPFEN